MNNPIYDIMKDEVRKHLIYLDKVLEAASKDPKIKEEINKSEFYTGLKFGDDKKEYGLLTHLYETQTELKDQCAKLEVEVAALRQDAQSYAVAINNMHKYLEEMSRNSTYYNQPRWFEVSNTLSKYGEY